MTFRDNASGISEKQQIKNVIVISIIAGQARGIPLSQNRMHKYKDIRSVQLETP